MSKFVIVGAGGHAKACIEVLSHLSMSPEFCIDIAPAHERVMGIEVISEVEALRSLHSQGIHNFFVAIGDNQLRCQAATLWLRESFTPITIISPDASVARTASIGLGVIVMPQSVIGSEANVRDFAVINSGAIVEHESQIGHGAHVAPGSVLGGKVTLGDRSLMGLGSAAIDGTFIGEDIIVGAGAVVVSDLTTAGIYLGIPARQAL
jgi:UDP-perosamine 4-acetyltransferase